MEGLGKGDACDTRDDFRQDVEEVSDRDDRTQAASEDDASAPAALALRGGTKVHAAYGCTNAVERGSICRCTCVCVWVGGWWGLELPLRLMRVRELMSR